MSEAKESVEAEYVDEPTDARTGEIVPRGQVPELKAGILAQIDISKVGTLELSDDTIATLSEPLDPADVRIRPDGLVYLPWTWYNKRLNKAFGLLKWGLIPQGSPMVKNMGNSTLVVWLNWLVVNGVPISMAGGEMSYQANNFTMSYGDAVEGARSNSLARNCKNLGMAIELWDADWVAAWRKQYAESYDDRGKTKWRKRGEKKSSPAKTETSTTATVEKVETAVGYVDKKTWDEHAERIAKDNDQSKSVPAAPTAETAEKTYSVKALSKFETVTMLSSKSGKAKSEVVKLIGTLDAKGSYTINSIIDMLDGVKENVAQ